MLPLKNNSKLLQNWPALAAKFLDAGLCGDRRKLELAALTAIREFKNDDPSGAKEIFDVLSRHRDGSLLTRGNIIAPPLDPDSTMSLVQLDRNTDGSPKPILTPENDLLVSRFLRERKQATRLTAEGFVPPSSLLLCGPPGTGKTMLARWIASELGLKLAALDLATAISSFLGRTGSNLRRILDYARTSPTVLLLDEFDSVAKRRDDSSDVGELKRIVNVLLKELEDWPEHSVLIAATNHSALLDPAIFRRFERVITIGLPTQLERASIIKSSLGQFARDIDDSGIQMLAAITDGVSGSNLAQMCKAAVRRHIIDGESIKSASIAEVASLIPQDITAKERSRLLHKVWKELKGEVSLRALGDLFHMTASTVHYHLKGERKKHVT